LFLKPIIRYVPSVKAEIIAIHLALKYRDNWTSRNTFSIQTLQQLPQLSYIFYKFTDNFKGNSIEYQVYSIINYSCFNFHFTWRSSFSLQRCITHKREQIEDILFECFAPSVAGQMWLCNSVNRILINAAPHKIAVKTCFFSWFTPMIFT
jgi:hypothetical protein